jgi:Tfp pilus assembly protein PilO
MTPSQRNILVFGPLALGLTVAFALTYPAYLDSEREHGELATKKKEYQEIALKVSERDRLDSLKHALESDINSLRNAVPKAPYVDLLMLDLERMATESKVNILALEQPDKQNQAESNDLEELMIKGKDKLAKIPPVIRPLAATATGAKAAEAPNQLGLKQVTKRLFITGEYKDMIAFVKHLETYQRVLTLKELTVATANASDNPTAKNAAFERAQKLKLNTPVMSFILNVYYLP